MAKSYQTCHLLLNIRRDNMPRKQIECETCHKPIRSDRLTGHKFFFKGVKRDKMSNQDQLDLPKEEIKIELKRRHDEKAERNEKRPKVMTIAEKINISIPAEEELLSTDKEEETRNKETLRQELITEKRQYIAKIELGKMILCIIDEEHIPEPCLNKEK